MQKKQLSVLVLIILCFLLGCNRETPKDESQQNYEDESNISKTNGEELVNINSELLGSTPFDIQIDKTALQTRKETETEVTIKTNLTDWGYTVSSEKGKMLNGAKWFGKVSTAVLYVVMFILILAPNIQEQIANMLIVLSGFLLLMSFILYIPVYKKY